MNLYTDFTPQQQVESFLRLQNFLIEASTSNKKVLINRLGGTEPYICGFVRQHLDPCREVRIDWNYHLGAVHHAVSAGERYTALAPSYQREMRLSLQLHDMLFNAGVQFTNPDDLFLYEEKYTDSLANSDLLIMWSGNKYKDDIQQYHSQIKDRLDPARFVCHRALEPYYFFKENDYKFNHIFQGKKVLIITSHSETTQSQISKLDKVYPTTPIFATDTQFHIYKGAQQNGGNHDTNSWIFHYKKMQEDLLNIKENLFDFDIALVACGAFGTILCDYIYNELDATALYVGGCMQLLFGIQGRRWDTSPEIVPLINKDWVRPSFFDRPPNPQSCENACYW